PASADTPHPEGSANDGRLRQGIIQRTKWRDEMTTRAQPGMEIGVGEVVVHYVEHGTGRPVLVLHGAGVDHREAEACFEVAFDGVAGLRRIYPDLPGMGRTNAPETLRSADDVLDTLLNFADEAMGGTAHLLI